MVCTHCGSLGKPRTWNAGAYLFVLCDDRLRHNSRSHHPVSRVEANAHGTVVAELNHNSAAPLVLTDSTGGLYHFTFAAGAASRKLTVAFLQSTANGAYDTIGPFGAGLAPLPPP